MPLFKKNKYKDINKYAKILPAKIQNKILLEALSKISGPKLVDYLRLLDTTEAKKYFDKYPDLKARLNNPLKNKLYPSMLKKAALLTPVFWFGLLPKVEQAKYMQRIKDNLPWNKRKREQEIKTKTELKQSKNKQVRFGVGREKVIASTESKYGYNGVVITASSKKEAIAIASCIMDISKAMDESIKKGFVVEAGVKRTLYRMITKKPFLKKCVENKANKVGNGIYTYSDKRMLSSEHCGKYGNIKVEIDVELNDDHLDFTKITAGEFLEKLKQKGCSDSIIEIVSKLKQDKKIGLMHILMYGSQFEKDIHKFPSVEYKSPQCEFGNEVVLFDSNLIKGFRYVEE